MKIALSGAGGIIGTILRVELAKRGFDLRAAGRSRPLEPLVEGEDTMMGDLRDPVVVDKLLTGVDVLVHMAGTSLERPLPEIIENNLNVLVQVYEGARRHKVRRVIFASSNHAFGMYPVDEKIALDSPYRPDGFYGLSKVWGEALARMYWDKHGIEGVCLRIGSSHGTPPTELRHLSTWLGKEDLVHLIERSIVAPNIDFVLVWGISNNSRAYCDNTGAERLGFKPRQNAEEYAAEVLKRPNPLDSVAQKYQGGGMASHDFTPFERRPQRSASGEAP